MDRLRIIVVVSSLIASSCQLSVRPASSITLNEHDPLPLIRCITAPTSTTFEWLLEGEVVLRRLVGVEGTTVLQGRDPEVYKTDLSANNQGSMVFKLIITDVSRHDDGRWTCRASLPEEEGNKVVNVNYNPDPQYPECGLDLEGKPTCTTQKGKPQVVLTWVDITGSSRETLREEGNVHDLDNNIYVSQVDPASVNPPANQTDSLTCEFLDDGAIRSCSFPKTVFFNFVSLKVSGTNDTTYSCSITPPVAYLRNNLAWEWTGEGLLAEQSIGVDSVEVEFINLDSMSNGEEVRCILTWGILSKEASVFLSVDQPIATSQSPSSIRPVVTPPPGPIVVTVHDRNEIPTRRGTVGDIGNATRSNNIFGETTSAPTVTSTESAPGNNTSAGVSDGADITTDVEELGGGPGILIIVIFIIVFIVAVVILVVLVCVCCCGKGKPTAAVI